MKTFKLLVLPLIALTLGACNRDDDLNGRIQFYSIPGNFGGECYYNVLGKVAGSVMDDVRVQYAYSQSTAQSLLNQDLATFADSTKGGKTIPVSRSSVFPYFKTAEGTTYYGYQVVYDCKYANFKQKNRFLPYESNTLANALSVLPSMEAEVDAMSGVKRIQSEVSVSGSVDKMIYTPNVKYLEVN